MLLIRCGGLAKNTSEITTRDKDVRFSPVNNNTDKVVRNEKI